ncbi:MAG: PLP-dependent aminotransferase family protein [Coriobacteriales bacterium]|jgi:GntR family transcriptional regulator/MocR family aminotransferase
MLDYDMGARGELSRYEYLYRCVRDDIVSGEIPAEQRLPSKRALARSLGVSVVTVESALAQLVAEGYVQARPRRGYYARRLPGPVAGTSPSAIRAARALTPAAPPGARPAPGRSGEGAGAPGADDEGLLADFTRASGPGVAPGARLWGRALRRTLAGEDEAELYAPAPARGALRLREAIARHLRASRGIVADPDRVVVGAGAQVLYGMVVQLLGPGLAYGVEDPGYPRLTGIYRAHGVSLRHVRLDGEGVDMDALRSSGAEVMHLMPSHQFPTGRVTSVARRYELLGWAA